MRCSKELKPIFLKLTILIIGMERYFRKSYAFIEKKKKWFSYISHEKKAFVYNETKRDIDFLTKKALSSIEYKQINRLWNCS